MADTLLFKEQGLSFVDTGMGLYLWQTMPAAVSLTVGELYRVMWDETEFNCQAFAANFNGVDGIGIGNLALAGLGANTEEPFLLGTAVDGSFTACYTTENRETYRLAIYHVAEEDREYLIWGSTLKAIGDAIREKTGSTEDMSPVDMPVAIAGITGGGGGNAEDVRYVTFFSEDGSVEYGKKAVAVGDDCADPIARGIFDTPAKENTAQYTYTFAGWSTTANGGLDANALKAVTEDRVVYANFAAVVNYYTIRYYDGATLLKTESLAYGTMPSYAPKKDGYTFLGWTPEAVAVTGDADYTARWEERITFANGSWAQIAQISESGRAADYFKVGDTKEITWEGNTYKMVVLGFDHDDLADGSGKAGMSIGCLTAYPTKVAAVQNQNTSQYTTWGNSYCTIYNTIVGFMSKAELSDIVAVAKKVTKYSYREFDDSKTKSTDTFFAFNGTEVGYHTKPTGSKYAYFSDNDSRKIQMAGSTTYVGYWLRDSAMEGSSSSQKYWYYVSTTGYGSSAGDGTTANFYPVFGFCI